MAASWTGIKVWNNENYFNTSDMLRVFGNLEYLMERTGRIDVSAEDKAKAVTLKSMQKSDIVYKDDFDWFFNQMDVFCAGYESAGGGFEFPNTDRNTLNGTLMTIIEQDMFLLRIYIMGGL